MEKGLFSGLFLIVMIVLLTPTFIISDQSRYVTDTYNHLNFLSLAVDNVIVDALLDRSFQGTVNPCTLHIESGYSAQVNSYIESLLAETNKNNITCSVLRKNTILSGNDYSGEFEINCVQTSKYVNITLQKTLSFNKEISVTNNGGTCTVIIKDNNDSQIYANQTRAI